jgi:hypothetical protein
MKRMLTALLLSLCLVLPSVVFADPTPAPVAAVAAPAPVAVPAPAAAVPAAPAEAVTDLNVSEPPAVPQVDADPMGFLVTIAKAIKNKNYAYAVGAILMFLAWAVRKFWTKLSTVIPDAALPWIVTGVSVLVSIGAQLIAGGSWWKAILAGLTSGGAAVALWESIFKHLLPVSAKKKK